MIQEKIRKIIEKAVSEENLSFSLEKPAIESHGDYSTNIALVLAKKNTKNPREVAKEIKEKIEKNNLFKKVEVAGPGFLNFFIKDAEFVKELKEIKKDFGKNKNLKGQKIIVEHTQPNPFKEFHIGHLMNNAIGESVARIIGASGATIKTASYHGDKGLHVAKAVWAMKNGMNFKEAYAEGNKAYEENETVRQEVTEINKKIYGGNQTDQEIYNIYSKGMEIWLVDFKAICKKLDSNFDYHFYESTAGEIGEKLVLKNIDKIFERGENDAIVFKGENFEPKTHTRVFLSAEGLPTYEGKEVGLAWIKNKKFSFDESVTVTANEQDSFFKVTEVAIGEIFPKLKGKLQHLSHGLLKLPTGKMSSRTGDVISAENMIEQVKEKVREKATSHQLDESDMEKIAIGAIKYYILKQSIGLDIIYDFEKSISFEGDSGPYLQYALTRALSVLEKAKVEKIKPSFKNLPEKIGELEKLLIYFPEVALRAQEKYQPHQIASYIMALASSFNSFYANNRIVDKKDTLSPYKIALVEKFSIIINNGLWMLGIPTPKKM